MDQTYQSGHYQNSELQHLYGPNVHIQRDALSWTYLSRLGHPETIQPEVTELVRILYRHLLHVVIASEFPKTSQSVEQTEFSSKQFRPKSIKTKSKRSKS